MRRTTRGTSVTVMAMITFSRLALVSAIKRDGEQYAGDRHQPVHYAHDDGVEPAHETGDKTDRPAR